MSNPDLLRASVAGLVLAALAALGLIALYVRDRPRYTPRHQARTDFACNPTTTTTNSRGTT